MRALVVEDDFTSRVVLQKMLARYCETHIAVDGKEAIEAFRTAWENHKPYDLVCLDIMMPEFDGQEVLREIRHLEAERDIRAPNRAKVIMTTSLSDKGNIMQAFEEQCEAYLVKPVDRMKLLSHLHDLGIVT